MLKIRRGQFQILAAFLVISILSAAVMTSFYRTQENSSVEPVTVSNTISEVNIALYKLLGFATGYYSSMIKVTGDYDYAQTETATYLDGGLKNIAQSHPDWGVSFTYVPSELVIDSDWYNYKSFTKGEWSIEYSLPTIGLEGIKLKTVAECSASIIKTERRVDSTYWSNVYVTMDDHPNLQLSKKNFQFFKYDSIKRTWQSVSLTSEPVLTTDGIYQIQIPSSTIDPEVYFVQVEDQRGIISQSGFIQGDPISGGWSNKSEMSFTYSIDWGVPNPFIGIKDIFTLELLQNGTIRWLGGRLPVKTNLDLTAEKPIPPISVKSLRVSKSTDNGVTWAAIPFQVEDWASDYSVPQGITNSKAIFNENCMIVFQIDHTYTNLKIGWDGKSSAMPSIQTSPFTDNPASHTLNNGKILMNANLFNGGGNLIKTTIPPAGGTEVIATFFRFNNNKYPVYGSDLSFVITNSIVRDIIQQEPEFGGGISGTPNTLAHIVITLPAGTTYYTYKLRALFLDTALTRTLTELSAISIDPSTGTTKKTENGVTGSNSPIIPLPFQTLEYYGGDDGAGVHRWSELVDDSSGKGAGIMMHDTTLRKLYEFDAPPVYRGYVRNDGTKIEINPVKNGATTNPLPNRIDITLYGAVVLFDGSINSQIFTPTNTPALSLMVDQPPSFIISLGTSNAPVAFNDAYSTSVSTQLVVNAVQGVLANDYDPNSNPITAVKVTDPSHGVLTAFGSNGSFTYTPTAGYTGSDSFTYKANDGSLDSNIATVTITIGAVNQAPVAVNDAYSTSMSTQLIINTVQGVLANDNDPESNPITAVKVTNPAHGAVTLNPNGSFTYTPTAGYTGSDSFTYKASDGSLDSNIATVTITVNAALSVSVAPLGPLTMNVGQTRVFTATPSGGTIPYSYKWYLDNIEVIGQTASTYTYTAALGSHTIYVRVTDSASTPLMVQSTTVTITVNAASYPPHYVDTATMTHDNPNVGSHSNFVNMQNDGSFDTLAEANTGIETWVNPTGFTELNWIDETKTYDDNTGTFAFYDIPALTWSPWLELSYPSTTGTIIRYWVTRENEKINNMQIEVFNSGTSAWENVYSGDPTVGAWKDVTFTSKTTNQIRLRLYNSHSTKLRTAYVHEVDIRSIPPPNYQLDLEVQFSGVTAPTSYTKLEIKTGAFSSENVQVYYWSGSWQLLTNSLTPNAVNQFTVSLSGPTFELKFYDTTRTGDITQNSWQIDYVRLVAP